jgi:predicted nucleic acid-binding protein
MTSMAPILIDINLLVYLFDQNQPTKQAQAQRVLEQLELNRMGRLSVQSLADFFSAGGHASSRRL